MRPYLIFLTILSLGILTKPVASAATYYIDYAAGDDSQSGNTADQSWKFCPGDTKAGGRAAAQKLAAGDVVLFKGGVEYPGDLDMKFSGAPGKPITFDGNSDGKFGEAQAVFSGATHITMKKCSSAAAAGGAKAWQQCFYADMPQSIDPLSVNLFYGDKRGCLARSPNIPDPMWWQDMEGFEPVADQDNTPTSVKIGKYALPAGQKWEESYVGIWNVVNLIIVKKIDSVSQDGKTITYEKVDPHKTNRHFALFNHPSLIDQPGEYMAINGGKRLVLLLGAVDKAPDVIISVRKYGINLNNQSHLLFKHLVLKNYSGDINAQRSGSGIISWEGGTRCADIAIEDCESSYNQTLSRSAGLQMTGIDGLRIEKCKVSENAGCRGILLASCKGVTIRNNTLERNGGTGIALFGSNDTVVENNTVTGHMGMHANGITVYLGSTNVVVQRNIVITGQIPMTVQSAHDMKSGS